MFIKPWLLPGTCSTNPILKSVPQSKPACILPVIQRNNKTRHSIRQTKYSKKKRRRKECTINILFWRCNSLQSDSSLSRTAIATTNNDLLIRKLYLWLSIEQQSNSDFPIYQNLFQKGLADTWAWIRENLVRIWTCSLKSYALSQLPPA